MPKKDENKANVNYGLHGVKLKQNIDVCHVFRAVECCFNISKNVYYSFLMYLTLWVPLVITCSTDFHVIDLHKTTRACFGDIRSRKSFMLLAIW